MATQAERDKRLDALKAAADAWFLRRTEEIQARVALAKRLLKGRTGSERLAASNTSAAKDAVINELNDFLTGG